MKRCQDLLQHVAHHLETGVHDELDEACKARKARVEVSQSAVG